MLRSNYHMISQKLELEEQYTTAAAATATISIATSGLERIIIRKH